MIDEDEDVAKQLVDQLHITFQHRREVIDHLLEKLKGYKSKLDDETWTAALQ
ncbi:MAG: hypothetical protein WAM14_00130 [Candidatus Nitrosopolaris sp.]